MLLAALTKPLGLYMARVLEGERTFLSPLLLPIENVVYRLCGVNPAEEMRWTGYAGALLVFSTVSFFYLYALVSLQHLLPFNPQQFPGLSADNAWNVAASFTTNTNWQFYSGESTMS